MEKLAIGKRRDHLENKQESPFKEAKPECEEEEKNIAILDSVFANLSLIADELTKGRSALKIPDLGDQESLIKRTSTASEIAKNGRANLLNTQSLLKELFSITGELERLTSEFVLHLQLGMSRKRAAEAMGRKQEGVVGSPPPRKDLFASPSQSSINPTPSAHSPDFHSHVKTTTSRILGSPERRQVYPPAH